MPITRNITYELLCHPHTQILYSEAEMAAALGITVPALLDGIKAGTYCYHFLERDISGAVIYWFQPECWEDNLKQSAVRSAMSEVEGEMR